MKIKQRKFPIYIAILIIASGLYFGFYIFAKSEIMNVIPKNAIEKKNELRETPTDINCSRTSRLDNEPQHDRALSLIQQRIDENNKWWDKYGEKIDGRFKHFPPELVNCIKISKESVSKLSRIEGYFIFNDKDIKKDYFPITVSADYDFADDIVTALLLSHEMTHVQQYIDIKNGKSALPCIDSEIDAFITQLDFYVILNNEENNSVYHRIQNNENFHSQLQILDAMMTVNRDSSCNVFDKNCLDTNLTNKLREMLTGDSHYIKQCDL
jgi:hypothetical protein